MTQQITSSGIDFDALIAEAVLNEELEANKQAAYAAQAKAINEAEAAKQANITEAYQRAGYVPGDFKHICADYTETLIKPYRETLGNQFTERAAYETEKNPDNLRIHKTLASNVNLTMSVGAVRVLLACEVQPYFVNQHIKANERYNVYAIDKIGRFVQQLDFGMTGNAINDAVFKSMWNFNVAGIEFDLDAAKCAASNEVRLKDGQKHWAKHLVSHTVGKSTASTQSGSTMRAMETLGLASVVKRDGKRIVYRLNDNPQVRRIAEVLGLA